MIIRNQFGRDGIILNTYLYPVIDENKEGREIVLLIKSKAIDNNGEFFTDSNGYLIEKRKIKFVGEKPTRPVEIAAEFYPMTTFVYLENEKKHALAIITDRAQGVASLSNGEIEIMLHRVCKVDDKKGVDEVLREIDESSNDLISV